MGGPGSGRKKGSRNRNSLANKAGASVGFNMIAIFSFSQNSLIKYDLSLQDSLILRWFASYCITTKKSIIVDNQVYYLIDYGLVLEDLPILKIVDPERIGIIFRKLERKKILCKVRRSISGKQTVFYRFADGVYDELERGDSMKLIDANDYREKFKWIPQIRNIVKKLLSIKIDENKYLFTQFDIDTPFVYSKQIQINILSIYQGRFLRDCIINDGFYEQNKTAIEKTKRMLLAVKNDWEAVEKLIINAAKNFALWYNPSYYPLSKTWLKKYKSVAGWLHNEFLRESMFMVCAAGKPMSAIASVSSNQHESMPQKVREKAELVLKELFPAIVPEDETKYWLGINSCLKAENAIREKYSKDYMVQMILGNYGDFVAKFLDWLPECFGENTKSIIKIRHVSSAGLSWDRWIEAEKDWGFSPSEIKKCYKKS